MAKSVVDQHENQAHQKRDHLSAGSAVIQYVILQGILHDVPISSVIKIVTFCQLTVIDAYHTTRAAVFSIKHTK